MTDILTAKMDKLENIRMVCVFFSQGQHARVDIIGINRFCWRDNLRLSFIEQCLPQRFIMLLPMTKAPVVAFQTGRNIGCHQGRFNYNGAGPTHRIKQYTLFVF